MCFFFLQKVYTAAFSSQGIGAQTVLKTISTTRLSYLSKGFKMRKIDSCVLRFSQCALKCLHVCNLKGNIHLRVWFSTICSFLSQGANFKQLRKMF